MKQLKLFALLGALLFSFIACNEEYEEVQPIESNEHHHYKIETKTFEELSKDLKFTTAFAKLPKQQTQNATANLSKTVMEVDYGFTIVDIPAKVMSDDEITSYTFLIYRDSVSEAYFENLVVQTDTTNTTKAVIVKYNLNSPVTYSEAHDSYYIDAEKEVTPIVYDNTPVDGKVLSISFNGDCMTIVETLCNNDGSGHVGGTHSAGDECKNSSFIWTQATTICGLGGGSGGSAGSGYGDGGASSSTTGGSTTGTVATTPVFGGGGGAPPPPLPANTTPCSELQKLLSNTAAKNKITELEGKTSEPKEYGYAFKTLPGSYNYDTPISIEADPKAPKKIDMLSYIGGDFIGAYHTHPVDGVPMFNHNDVHWLYTATIKANKPRNDPKVYYVYFLTMTCSSGTYAIKIKNFIQFSTFINNNYLKFQRKIEKFQEQPVLTGYNGGTQHTQTDYEENFLELLQEFNGGIGLYKLNDSKTQWAELNLNDNPNSGNPVLSTPCN